MLSNIQVTGRPIWPLILYAILAVALIIDRLIQLQTLRVLPPQTLEKAIQLTRDGLSSRDRSAQIASAGTRVPILASGLNILAHSPCSTEGEAGANLFECQPAQLRS